MYDRGNGTEKDFLESSEWYKKSVLENYKYSQYSLGKLYMDHKIVYDTNNEKQNYEIAYNLFKQSALQDNAYASFELGKMTQKGIGTILDKAASHKHYEIALNGFLTMLNEREDDNLLYRVEKMYQEGNGVEIDIEKAIEYFKEASNLNNVNAQLALANIYMKRDNEYIEKAINLLVQLAEKNNDMAQYSLGKIFINEEYINFDSDVAINWFHKSAKSGNQYAQYQLGKIYLEGKYVVTDEIHALEYLTLSAGQNNSYAQYSLSKIYLNENSNYYDLDKGLEYLTKSGEQGNEYAQCKLGIIYLWGKGVQKDEELGMKWLNKAIEQGNEFAKECLSNYNNNNIISGEVYGLVKTIFNMLPQQKENANWRNDILFRSKSKLAMKEAALHDRLNNSREE